MTAVALEEAPCDPAQSGSFPDLGDDHRRVAVRRRADNERLVAAFEALS